MNYFDLGHDTDWCVNTTIQYDDILIHYTDSQLDTYIQHYTKQERTEIERNKR